MAEEKKITVAQEEVDKALTKLATASVSPDFHYEYLHFICEVMDLYDEFGQAVDNDDTVEILELSNQIRNRIDFEFEKGFLSN